MSKVVRLEPFAPHIYGEQRRACIRQVIGIVLDLPLDDEYKAKILRDLIWKYTEADGKHNVRHRSAGAASAEFESQKELKSKLRHDHVFPIDHLLKGLMRCSPAQRSDVLEEAVSCLVTMDEHLELSRWDKTHPGWAKYEKAKVQYHG